MKIIEFLEENKTELFNKVIEEELVDADDVEEGYFTIEDLELMEGCYEKGDDLIDTDEICSVMEGLDLSFKRKFVKDTYGGGEIEWKINGKKIYGLIYNV